MSRWTKAAFFCVICSFLAAIGYISWQRQESAKNDGFAIHKIYSSIPNDPEWELPEPEPYVRALLRQPFYYLGHGLQFYAFESKDGRYVLKFLRHQRLRPNPVIEQLPDVFPLSWLKKYKEEECQKRIGYIFRSLIVAYQDVPEETGMLYVHLNKTKHAFPTVQIFDKLQESYQVPLDTTEFVLQKKATLVKPTLSKLMQEGHVAQAKKRIDQIFQLLQTCAKKGICDTDNQLIRKNNLGFLEDRAIYVDTGKLTRKESMKTKERFVQDLQRLDPLYSWLQENYPELASHFAEQKPKVIEAF